MILRAKLKVTRTLSTEKLDNLAVLGDRTLKLRGDVGPHQQMTLQAKVIVKVTMTFSTKKAYNLAVLEARTLELRWDVGPDQ